MSTAAAAVEEGRQVVRALALAHRCVSGCPACDAEEAASPAIGRLTEFDDYVISKAADRVARWCQRSGAPFPKVSKDEVVQFCVEEALFERIAIEDKLAKIAAQAEGLGLDEPVLAPGPRPAWSDPALDRARHFAATGEEPN